MNEILAKYLEIYPEDKDRFPILLGQLDKKENLNDRYNYTGHITGSGLVFSPDLRKALLIYHPSFHKWMQPGGHWEDDEEGPWLATKREVIEETGVKIASDITNTDSKVPILIESHLVKKVPPKNEPDHYHHAFWYAYVARSEDLTMADIVIKEAKWVLLENIAEVTVIKAIKRAMPLLGLKA